MGQLMVLRGEFFRPVLAINVRSEELKNIHGFQKYIKLKSVQLILLCFLRIDPPTGLLIPQVGNSGTYRVLQFIRGRNCHHFPPTVT